MSETEEAATKRRSLANRPHPVRKLAGAFVSADSYGLVIVLIVLSYAFLVSVKGAWPSALVILFQIATVWFVFRTSRVPTATRLVGLAIVVAGVAAATTQVAVGATDPRPSPILPLISALLYLIAVGTILRHVALRPVVDMESALGAIAAYLCLGMFFAFTYRTVALWQNGPFFGSAGDGNNADSLFFSMTTLTTTGYGNLVPAGNPGQSIAVSEMVLGQLFLLAAVGKVIGALPGRRRQGADDDQADEDDGQGDGDDGSPGQGDE